VPRQYRRLSERGKRNTSEPSSDSARRGHRAASGPVEKRLVRLLQGGHMVGPCVGPVVREPGVPALQAGLLEPRPQIELGYMNPCLRPYNPNRGAPPNWLVVVSLILVVLWLLTKILP
jgi:hypothetical protein